jgi:hypothetical protein
VSVATARPTQMGCRHALPRSLAIAHRNPPVATKPHSHVVKAAMGRCSCSLPGQVRGKDADQHHSSPDTCEATHAPHQPRAIGHRRALARTRYLHVSHHSSLRIRPAHPQPVANRIGGRRHRLICCKVQVLPSGSMIPA